MAAQIEETPVAVPLRFGAVSFYNPRLMYLKYQPLADYLTAHTAHAWELVVSPSYEETVQQLCAGELAAAYLGPFTYVVAHESCGAFPVVRLQTNGMATYESVIMVRADSPISSLRQLAGKVFGFGSPFSTSAHLVPRAMLLEAGLRVGVDVECRYLLHHEKAARAVLLGEVDACGIRDIVGEKFLDKGLRVLARSAPVPNFPFVMAPGSDRALGEELVRALVILPAADPRVRAEIATWDEELAGGFNVAHDADYERIRVLARKVFGGTAFSLAESAHSCRAPGR